MSRGFVSKQVPLRFLLSQVSCLGPSRNQREVEVGQDRVSKLLSVSFQAEDGNIEYKVSLRLGRGRLSLLVWGDFF